MSIRVMTAVFDYSESTGSDRLVLLVIADRSADDGSGCWRGKESIAHMARVSRATVTRALANLEALGELVVDRRPGTTSEYRIVLPTVDNSAPPAQSEPTAERPGSKRAGGRLTGEPGVGSPVSRDTSLDIRKPRARAREAPTSAQFSAPAEPAPTHLGRGKDAMKLWDIRDDGTLVWLGDGPEPKAPEPRWRSGGEDRWPDPDEYAGGLAEVRAALRKGDGRRRKAPPPEEPAP
jgi:hypothetical protein